MPIRCCYENNGQGIVLREIESPADAIKVRDCLLKRGIAATVVEPAGLKDFRVVVAGIPLDSFLRLLVGSDIALVD